MSFYDATEPIHATGRKLAPGEYRFTVQGATEAYAKNGSGRTVWTFKLATTAPDGVEVRRTHRITRPLAGEAADSCAFLHRQLARMIDAVGRDPNRPDVQEAILTGKVKAAQFVGRALSALVEDDGEYDRIAEIIPSTYRAQWEAARRKAGPAAPAAAQSAEREPGGDDDVIPF